MSSLFWVWLRNYWLLEVGFQNAECFWVPGLGAGYVDGCFWRPSQMFFRSQISVGSLENLNIRATGDHTPHRTFESPPLPDLGDLSCSLSRIFVAGRTQLLLWSTASHHCPLQPSCITSSSTTTATTFTPFFSWNVQ